MKIAETIKEIRTKLKMTQVELAEKSGVTQNYISRVESGSKNPSKDVIHKIGSAFGLTGEILGLYTVELEDINPKHKDTFQKIIKPVKSMIDEIIEYELEKRKNETIQTK